ncbi:NAD/NADP-dependent betaine aldehyde dehydrogenase [Pseudomonas sp. MM221]|nr:NAD/NADP-dependent betaine aldehyde dehydrogenase [Pseudomonas sp. MM221]
MNRFDQFYINGQWVSPINGGSFNSYDPSDESLIASVASGCAADVDVAVKAARAAFDEGPWPRLSGAERGAYLRKIAEGIRARQEALAELEVRDNGKPFPEALWDIGDTAGCFDYYANLAEALDAQREKPVALADDRFSPGAQGTHRRSRRHRAVELPDADGFVEDRAGPGRGLLHHPQTGRADFADCIGACAHRR